MAARAVQHDSTVRISAAALANYPIAAGAIRTHPEGRNTHPITHPTEHIDVREAAGAGNDYQGYTFQRLGAGTPHVPAAELTGAREFPNHKIPFSWWSTFLPPALFRNVTAAGNRVDHSVNWAGDQRKRNRGPEIPALAALDIPAPTKSKVVDHADPNPATRNHPIVANARPQILYPRTNTIDRDDAKDCAYGKIRDPSTNSWRCVRNPNHHRTNFY
jgi:hypothetical protein